MLSYTSEIEPHVRSELKALAFASTFVLFGLLAVIWKALIG